MDRRRRGIINAGVYVRGWWYQLDGQVPPWLATLGSEPYIPHQPGAEQTSACTVTLAPYEHIVTASWEKGSSTGKPKLEQVDGVRPSPTREVRIFQIAPGMDVNPCKPGSVDAKKEADGEPPGDGEQNKEVATVRNYNSVFVAGSDERGTYQLRFERQSNGVFRVTVSSIDSRRH